MKRKTWIIIISYAFIWLFLYTAISKLIEYERSLDSLLRSPFISDFAVPISIFLPFMEFIIAGMLFIPRYRLIGLYCAAVLMMMFTVYVSAMVFTHETLPCSCGGLIRYLTWKQHFYFNIVATTIAFMGIWLHRKDYRIDHNKLQLT